MIWKADAFLIRHRSTLKCEVYAPSKIFETEALTRRFGTFTAVDALTISVGAGEVFGLGGPNGAGKTTVIKMLTTLLRPTSGRARVAGFDLTRQAGSVRRAIGYVPQAVRLYPRVVT
jgi:ABC-2 type transport system ATP-binding protein